MKMVKFLLVLCILSLFWFSVSFRLSKLGATTRLPLKRHATYSRAPPVGKIKVEAVIDKFLSCLPIPVRNQLFNQSTHYEWHTDGFVFDGHIISYGATCRQMLTNHSIFVTELNINTDIEMFDNPYFRLQKNRLSTEFRDMAQKFYNSLTLGLGPQKIELEYLTHKKEFRVLVWSENRTKLMRIRLKLFQSPRMKDAHRAFYSKGMYVFRKFQSIKHTMTSLLKPPPCPCPICTINVIR